eukprot:CAMPEP_0179416230 /NCGR_PEP_ID=MMETSP0799-20121207/6678_1 /TAXON_ID=46947 /ORGANISM="Geminigera cryophila, Strain CCMP2564" /LENGTH=177 /DNA_ID=CAMNT_0021189069 /DNA_START=214 /DNA_END=748 /DNA_ORIENTATION=+
MARAAGCKIFAAAMLSLLRGHAAQVLRDLPARTDHRGRANIRGGRAPAPTSESRQKKAKTYQEFFIASLGDSLEYFSDDEEVGAAPVESVAGPTTPPRHQKMSATPQLHTPRSKVPKQDLEANEEADDAPASQKATQERGCRSGMHTDADPESTTAKALDPQLKNEANLTDHSNSSQ